MAAPSQNSALRNFFPSLYLVVVGVVGVITWSAPNLVNMWVRYSVSTWSHKGWHSSLFFFVHQKEVKTPPLIIYNGSFWMLSFYLTKSQAFSFVRIVEPTGCAEIPTRYISVVNLSPTQLKASKTWKVADQGWEVNGQTVVQSMGYVWSRNAISLF